MKIDKYLNRNYFDTQRGKHKTIRLLSNLDSSFVFETENNELLKIRIEDENKNMYKEKLEWLQNNISFNTLENVITLPTGILNGLKYNEVGYVSKLGFENLLNDYIKPSKNEKLFKWYFDKTGGIEYRLELGIEIAKSLCKIHNEGFCYIDINPSSISVTSYENCGKKKPSVKFISPENISSYMNHPISLGSDRYMDPLVSRGVAGNSIISDTYSFAVVLFELLTLQHPFLGEQCEGLSVDELTEKLNCGEFDYIDDKSADNFNEEFEDIKFFLTDNLKELFFRMFVTGKLSSIERPTLLEFKEACENAKKNLICCTNKECGRTYTYNEMHRCPFCNRVTEQTVMVTSKRLISSNKEILLPHGEFKTFTSLPIIEIIVDTMVLKPGINRITKKFFDKSLKDDEEILLIKLNIEDGKLTIRNNFSKTKIKVITDRKTLEPFSIGKSPIKSDYSFPLGTLKVIGLNKDISLLDEENLEIETTEYGSISHKYVLEIK